MVIESLLKAASHALPEPIQIHKVKARDGSTALQVACACGADVGIIQALCDPPSRLLKRTNLLHHTDQQGGTPLTDLVVQYTLARKSPQNRGSPCGSGGGGGSDESLPQRTQLVDDFQTKMETIIRTAWYGRASSSFSSSLTRPHSLLRRGTFVSIVHGAAHCAYAVPPLMWDLLVRSYPHMVATEDARGILPLHLALCRPAPCALDLPPSSTAAAAAAFADKATAVLRGRHAYGVSKLLDIYPESALKRLPNGRLPLTQAVASGYHWNVETVIDFHKTQNQNHSRGECQGPVAQLWLLTQSHLEDAATDPFTGLPLFGLAAAAAASCTRSSIHREEEFCPFALSTIFELLRREPNALAGSCK